MELQRLTGQNLHHKVTVCFENIACFSSTPYTWREISSLLFKFIWKGGSEKIRRDILIGPWDLGGANMVDLVSLSRTLHLRWVCRRFEESRAQWKVWFNYNTRIPDLNTTFECNLAPKHSTLLLKNNDESVLWNEICNT